MSACKCHFKKLTLNEFAVFLFWVLGNKDPPLIQPQGTTTVSSMLLNNHNSTDNDNNGVLQRPF